MQVDLIKVDENNNESYADGYAGMVDNIDRGLEFSVQKGCRYRLRITADNPVTSAGMVIHGAAHVYPISR